jgi:uncharacterized membrane protein
MEAQGLDESNAGSSEGPAMARRGRALLAVSIVLLAAFAYDGVVRRALIPLVHLPVLTGSLSTLTAVLALSGLAHAWYSLGGRLTLAFFAISAVIAWTFEEVGVATGLVYGAYHYTDYLGAKLGNVPLIIPMAWFMMIYPSYVIANLALDGRATGTRPGVGPLLRLAAASAAVMTVWDLVIDPILSGPHVRAWIWDDGGQYFGVPIQNYAGWLVTTVAVYLVYRAIEQHVPPSPVGPMGPRVVAMPVLAYGLMLAADLLSGITPEALAVIGPIAMGPPLIVAAWRLFQPAGKSSTAHGAAQIGTI